jgi:hypothetical protein
MVEQHVGRVLGDAAAGTEVDQSSSSSVMAG